ncbi:GGDEF domain-containing protein [soil metagenome]
MVDAGDSQNALNAERSHSRNSESSRRYYEDFERRRQFHLLYLFNSFAALVLFGFGISAALSERIALGLVILVLCIIAVANLLILKFTGRQRFARFGFSCGALILCGYLLATGGVNGTGPLWWYPTVAVVILLQGARRGLPVIAIMVTIMLTIFFVQLPGVEFAVYPLDLKLRFMATFGTLAMFVGLHEFARSRNQEELFRVADQLDQLSHTDQLTGLPNRRYMIGRLESENSRHQRHGRPYSILYGDIDDFKAINDTYGHQAGDAVLQAIAQALREHVRQHDEICRWGGEEFLILLPEADQPLACEVAEKLRATIAAMAFRYDGADMRLTMSFGVHTVDTTDKIEAFIHFADQKLYRAKNTGKNCVVAQLQDQPQFASTQL